MWIICNQSTISSKKLINKKYSPTTNGNHLQTTITKRNKNCHQRQPPTNDHLPTTRMKEETTNVTTYQYLPSPLQTNKFQPPTITKDNEHWTTNNHQQTKKCTSKNPFLQQKTKQTKQNTLNKLQTSVRFRSKFMLSHIDLCKFTKKKFTMFT